MYNLFSYFLLILLIFFVYFLLSWYLSNFYSYLFLLTPNLLLHIIQLILQSLQKFFLLFLLPFQKITLYPRIFPQSFLYNTLHLLQKFSLILTILLLLLLILFILIFLYLLFLLFLI